MAKYKFRNYPKNGLVTVSEGYASLVIIDQIADVDPANPEQLALAEKRGGKPAIVNVVEEKSTKKAAKSNVKNQ